MKVILCKVKVVSVLLLFSYYRCRFWRLL